MLQSSQNAANRRRMLTKVLAFVALVAVMWLQPKVQSWLDSKKAGGPDHTDRNVPDNSADSATGLSPPGRRRVVIKEVDQPPVAEIERSEISAIAVPNKVVSPPKAANKESNSDGARNDPPAASPKLRPAESRSTADSGVRDADTTREESQPDPEPALGELREIRDHVFESTAGLRYQPGSDDRHRLRHVMQHAKDDLTKPIHGVFEGDRNQILAVIDEAFQKAKAGGRDVRSEMQNDRLVYTVNLGRKIGYMGGSEGERKGNPDCRYIRIVLEDKNIVVSAYPTKSF